MNLEAACWSAGMLYRACQFLVWREMDGQVVKASLALAGPTLVDAAACRAVDLYFRYLPDVIALSRGVSESDPLVQGLMQLAAAWPLSSVGVRGVKPGDVTPFIQHAALRQLYVDRIIDHRDQSRLDDPRVRGALVQTAGAYPALLGPLAAALTPAAAGAAPATAAEGKPVYE